TSTLPPFFPLTFTSLDAIFFFFFFQAEDGIRDGHVTGVQTCALPILFPPSLTFIRAAAGCSEFLEHPTGSRKLKNQNHNIETLGRAAAGACSCRPRL